MRGRFLTVVEGRYRPPFRVISAEQRQALSALVDARVAPMLPRVAAMLDRLALAVGGRVRAPVYRDGDSLDKLTRNLARDCAAAYRWQSRV